MDVSVMPIGSSFSFSLWIWWIFVLVISGKASLYSKIGVRHQHKRDSELNIDRRSPFFQDIPDCQSPYIRIQKTTTSSAIVCPMIRDEKGFLSEFVAFYQMMGFNHIMFFDHGSTDNGFKEIDYWIQTGFVSVVSNFTIESLGGKVDPADSTWYKIMKLKGLAERECKRRAQAMNITYFVSVDLDEYIIPYQIRSVVDVMDDLFKRNEVIQYRLHKINFVSSPHLLEPVDLLTIEAYQVAHPTTSDLTYFKAVMPKVIIRLNAPFYTDDHRKYVVDCCSFHGCDDCKHEASKQFCEEAKGRFNQISHAEQGKIFLHHYARSLEKYEMKGKTWQTSSGDLGSDSSSYDITGFLDRSIGWKTNRDAVVYGCQVREILQDFTNMSQYFRPGDYWYKNVEFGRPMNHPLKGRRNNRPAPDNFKYNHPSPYNYKYNHKKTRKTGV